MIYRISDYTVAAARKFVKGSTRARRQLLARGLGVRRGPMTKWEKNVLKTLPAGASQWVLGRAQFGRKQMLVVMQQVAGVEPTFAAETGSQLRNAQWALSQELRAAA